MLTRLQVPLDQCGDPAALPDPLQVHAARVALDRRGIVLVIGSGDQVWCRPVQPAAMPAVAGVFAPVVDGFGDVRVRPARAVVGCSTTHLIIDLWPAEGTWVRLGRAVELEMAAWAEVLPPVAAAVVMAAVSLPVSAATYEVRPGDTLTSISRTLFGSPTGWRQLFDRNRHLLADPDRLVPGTVLQVPEAHTAHPAPAAAGRHVVVRPGDTLFTLAKRHLGDGARWRVLWAGVKHRIASPSRLPVGMPIPLPPETATAQSPSESSTSLSPLAAVVPSPLPSSPAAEPHVAMEPPQAEAPQVVPSEAPPPPIVDPVPAAVEPLVPVAVPPSIRAAAIERPFSSHVGVSFDPVTYHEHVAVQQVTARGTIFNAFGAEGGWRLGDHVELSGLYLFNGYPMTRVVPTSDRRMEHHGRLTGSVVWPLLPQLELAAGLGGQLAGYGVAAGPPVERPEDVYDTGYQRLLAHAEAKVGWRPWPDRPLTVTAGVTAIPFGQGFRLGGAAPVRLWGFGWTAGLRYSLEGFALETGYRGQRLFGDGYGQSADLLHTGIAYYFR